MRLNKYIAQASGLSRREADRLIQEGRVTLNGEAAEIGQSADPDDVVRVDGEVLEPQNKTTILLNKPPGYITSRTQQGATPTIYALLPESLRALKYIGRLDKDSRGLLLLTNDGDLMQELTHPSFEKSKIYYVVLDSSLSEPDRNEIQEGVELDDGISKLDIAEANSDVTNTYNLKPYTYRITMREGRNRQIRRTFAALGYEVVDLLRTEFGEYSLGDLEEGEYRKLG